MLLQMNMCIAYFFGGFDKILGPNWHNGESIWKAIHMIETPHILSLDSFSNTPLFAILGWLTIITELGYMFFMNIPKIRMYGLAAIISMHLFIAVFLGLFFFSGFMIILSLSAYYAPYYYRRAAAPAKADFDLPPALPEIAYA